MPELTDRELWLACEWCGEDARDPERQTDYFVGQRLGWTPPHHPLPGDAERTFKIHDWFFNGWSTSPPDFSTGDGMLLVLEAMRGRGFRGEIQSGKGKEWVAFFDRAYGDSIVFIDERRYADSESLPRAVALAAKAALEA